MNLIMKKELHELVYNPKTILNVFLMLVLPHIPSLKHSPFLYHTIIASSIFAGGQFIYDSFYNETVYGGKIFILNMKISPIVSYLQKVLISVAVCLSTLPINIFLTKIQFYISDLLFIMPLCFFSTTIMYLASIVLKKYEASAGFVTIGISLIALSFIMSFDSILFKMLFSIVLAFISFFATYYLSNSTYYRSQL